jgi:hypothetical protein
MFDLSFEEQFLVEETRFQQQQRQFCLSEPLARPRRSASGSPPFAIAPSTALASFRAASRLSTLLIAHALASRTR